jgi:uncharacterized membrane protein
MSYLQQPLAQDIHVFFTYVKNVQLLHFFVVFLESFNIKKLRRRGLFHLTRLKPDHFILTKNGSHKVLKFSVYVTK